MERPLVRFQAVCVPLGGRTFLHPSCFIPTNRDRQPGSPRSLAPRIIVEGRLSFFLLLKIFGNVETSVEEISYEAGRNFPRALKTIHTRPTLERGPSPRVMPHTIASWSFIVRGDGKRSCRVLW
ncbi:hypothetical protein V2G26_014852 [Clonostachys chloroleuca]